MKVKLRTLLFVSGVVVLGTAIATQMDVNIGLYGCIESVGRVAHIVHSLVYMALGGLVVIVYKHFD